MLTKIIHTLRHSLLACVIFLLLLAGILAFVFPLRGASSAFAAVLQAVTATCVQAPSPEHCDAKDPEKQGCASSARTTAHALIESQGRTVGKVERRYSVKCKSWWGRVFDFRPGPQRDLYYIEIDGQDSSGNEVGYGIRSLPRFMSASYTILYGNMFFDAKPTYAAPRIIGAFSNTKRSVLSATVPAAPAPAK
jgi:hypothetical protein